MSQNTPRICHKCHNSIFTHMSRYITATVKFGGSLKCEMIEYIIHRLPLLFKIQFVTNSVFVYNMNMYFFFLFIHALSR